VNQLHRHLRRLWRGLIRISNTLAKAGELDKSYELLKVRKSDFASDARYLHALCQLSISASREVECLESAEDIVHLAQSSQELEDAIRMALKLILRADKKDEYIEKLKGQEEISPQDLSLLVALHATDDLDKARGLILSEKSGQTDLAQSFWANLLIQKNYIDEATEVLRELVKKPSARNAVLLRKLCQLQKSAGDSREALKTCQIWKEIAPNDKIAWIWESELLVSEGENEKALAMLRRAIARFEKSDDLKSLLSKQYVNVGMHEDACQTLWKAFENTDSVDSKIYWSRQLVELSYNLARLDELERTFLARKSKNPKSLSPVLALIQIAEKEQDIDAKKRYTLEALSLQPSNEKLLFNLADVEERLSNPVKAEEYYRAAYDVAKSKMAHSRFVKFYLRTGQEMKAFSLVQPQQDQVSNREAENTAIEMYMLGYLEGALKSIETRAISNPEDWRINYLYGVLLEDSGYTERAVQVFINLSGSDGDLEGVSPSQVVENLWSSQGKRSSLFIDFQRAYRHHDSLSYSYRQSNVSLDQLLVLPQSSGEAQDLAVSHLLNIVAVEGGSALSGRLLKHLEKEGVEEPKIASEIIFRRNFLSGNQQLKDMLLKYPDSKLLIRLDSEYFNQLSVNQSMAVIGELDSDPDIQLYVATQLLLKESAKEEFDLGVKVTKGILAEDTREPGFYLRYLSNVSDAILRPSDHLDDERLAVLQGLLREVFDFVIKHEPDNWHQMRIPLFALALGHDDERVLKILNSDLFVRALDKPKSQVASYYGNTTDFGHFIYQNENFINSILGGDDNLHLGKLGLLNLKSMKEGSELTEIKNNLKSLLPEIISPIVRAKILMLNDDFKSAREVIKSGLEGAEKNKQTYHLMLSGFDHEEKKYDLAFEQLLEVRKTVSGAYMKARVDACILNMAEKMEKSEVAKNHLILVQVMNAFRSSSNIFVQSVVVQKAEALGVQLPKKKRVSQKVQQQRNEALQGLSGTPHDERYKRVKTIAEAGESERAASLATRLFLERIRLRYNQSNGITELVDVIKGNDLTKGVLSRMEKGSDISAIKNDYYASALTFLGDDKKSFEVAQSLKDDRAPASWKGSREALLLYPTDSKAAIQRMKSLVNENELAMSVPRSVNISKKHWYSWGALMAGLMKELDMSQLKERDMYWIVDEVTQLASSKNFGNRDYVRSVFDINGTMSSQDKKRLENVSKMAEIMLNHPDTSLEGFKILTLLSKKGRIEPDKMKDWLHQVILSGTMSAKPLGSLNRNSYSSMSHDRRGNVISFPEVLCLELKALGGKALFPKSFLDNLLAQDKDTYTAILKLMELAELRGAKFDAAEKSVSGEWAKKNDVFQKLAAQLHRLAPYDLKRANEEVSRIIPKLIQSNKLNYEERIKLITETKLLVSAVYTDVSSDAVTEVYKDLAEGILGDRTKWKTKTYQNNSNNTVEYSYYKLQAAIMSEPQLVVPILRSCWLYDLPCTIGSYSVIQQITQTGSKSSEEIIQRLERMGLLKGVKEFFPLSTRESNWNSLYKVEQVLHPMVSLNRRIPTEEHWKPIVEMLSKRKEGRFGALLTAASISKDSKKQKELVNLAFTDYAKDLVMLPEAQLFAIYSSFKKSLQGDPVGANKDLVKLNARFKKIEEEESDAAMKSTMADLKSGKSFSNPHGNRQVMNSVVGTLCNIPAKKAELSVELVRLFEAAFSKSLRNGGQYSYYTSSSGPTDSLYESVISQTLYKMEEGGASEERMLVFVANILDDEELKLRTRLNSRSRRKLENLVSSSIKKILDGPDKTMAKHPQRQLNELVKQWGRYPQNRGEHYC